MGQHGRRRHGLDRSDRPKENRSQDYEATLGVIFITKGGAKQGTVIIKTRNCPKLQKMVTRVFSLIIRGRSKPKVLLGTSTYTFTYVTHSQLL